MNGLWIIIGFIILFMLCMIMLGAWPAAVAALKAVASIMFNLWYVPLL